MATDWRRKTKQERELEIVMRAMPAGRERQRMVERILEKGALRVAARERQREYQAAKRLERELRAERGLDEPEPEAPREPRAPRMVGKPQSGGLTGAERKRLGKIGKGLL